MSVIDTATNTVIGSPVSVGGYPNGVAIQPAPGFIGTPGSPNCEGSSIAALSHKYGGLQAAAKALGVSVSVLHQDALEFCGG